jgi:hypothetical protein
MLTENAKNFLAKNPVLIATVAGIRFYECPVRGDESPLRYITPEGKLKTSDFWEAPSLEEVLAI